MVYICYSRFKFFECVTNGTRVTVWSEYKLSFPGISSDFDRALHSLCRAFCTIARDLSIHHIPDDYVLVHVVLHCELSEFERSNSEKDGLIELIEFRLLLYQTIIEWLCINFQSPATSNIRYFDIMYIQSVLYLYIRVRPDIHRLSSALKVGLIPSWKLRSQQVLTILGFSKWSLWEEGKSLSQEYRTKKTAGYLLLFSSSLKRG